jgi:hypothetical protein
VPIHTVFAMPPLRLSCTAVLVACLAFPAAAAARTPNTRITSGPANRATVKSSRVSFSFAATMRRSHFQCSLDGRRFRACGSPAVYRSLHAGRHTFAVRALNRRGRADRSPARRRFTIVLGGSGTAGPTTTGTGGGTNGAPPSPQTSWAPVGAAPRSDAAAAALTTRRPEIRPDNAAANAYVPSDAELAAFHAARNSYDEAESYFNPLRRFVTGRSGIANPSTDELIQWTAHKWGFPEDIIRAQMAVESWWRQSAMGDLTPESDPGSFPAFSCPGGGSSCYESLGLAQDRWRPDGSLNPGSEPLRWKSTAFNLDLYGANIRFYYDGYAAQWGPGMTDNGYTAGQDWMSIGAHFNPYPWNNQGQRDYIAKVQDYLAKRTWQTPEFVAG